MLQGLRPKPWHGAALLLCFAHFLTLTRLPFMHADEAWLASSTRAILRTGDPAAPPDFAPLASGPQHAIRLLFHGLQAPFVASSWSLAAVRLLSLVSAATAIGLAAYLARRVLETSAARWLFVGALSLDPQVFVSSHIARQEIVLLAALLAALVLRSRGTGRARDAAAVGTVLGLAIGVHANSLVIALPVWALYARDVALAPAGRRRQAVIAAAVLAAVLAAWAGGWIGASRLVDPAFPRAYLEFGRRYGVGDSLAVKLLGLPGFYARLFERIGGTYYVPDVRLPLLVFALGAVVTAGLLIAGAIAGTQRRTHGRMLGDALTMLVAANAGLVLIGKLSQPAAVLLFPAGYLLTAALVDRIGPRRAAAGALLAALAASTVVQALPWLRVSYSAYIGRIRAHVPGDARVLAGLNTAFAFDAPGFRAFQDLAVLGAAGAERGAQPGRRAGPPAGPPAGLTFDQYIDRLAIAYILVPDELERIYAERPVWNDLYGNVAPYYADMQRFLRDRCTLVASWDEPVFAMRMVAYTGQGPSRLRVYKVEPGP